MVQLMSNKLTSLYRHLILNNLRIAEQLEIIIIINGQLEEYCLYDKIFKINCVLQALENLLAGEKLLSPGGLFRPPSNFSLFKYSDLK